MHLVKKNILFYIGALEAGGAERVLLELLKYLNREKYNLTLVINRPEGYFFKKIPEHVEVIVRSDKRRSYYDLYDRIFGLPNIINKEKTDLVIAIMSGAGRSMLRTRYFVENNTKMIVRIGQNPTKKLAENTSWLWSRIEFFEIKEFFPKADAIIATSEGIQNNLVTDNLVYQDKVHVIYNPLDLDMINQKKLETFPLPQSFSNNYKLIVAIGRLVPQKGYDTMLRAFKKIRKQIPAKLIVLGGGYLESKLRVKIRELDLENDVHLAGFVENPWAYLQQADLYLSTSLYEGFHLTIAEAMACGVVPVATDCDYGPREIITDGVDGKLVPVDNAELIAETVIDLLQDSGKRNEMAIKALERAKDFDVSIVVKEYERLFDSLLNGN